jgi:hypothetical protein
MATKVGETEKARKPFDGCQHQERLEYYAGTNLDEQYSHIDEIIADMEAWQDAT